MLLPVMAGRAVDPNEAVIRALGPTLWAKFNEGTGNPQDSSGNGHHGTLVGAPTWGATGLSFDGTDDAVDFGDLGIAAPPITVIKAITNDAADGFAGGWPPAGGAGLDWRNNSGGGSIATRQSDGGAENILVSTGGPITAFFALRMTGTNFNTLSWIKNGDAAVAATVDDDAQTLTASFNIGGSAGTFRAFTVHYGIVFDYALDLTEIQDVRTALTAILANRGVTLP